MVKADGYAVVRSGSINVNTVSLTKRGAMVNWLFADCSIQVLNNWSDEKIETTFRAESKKRDSYLSRVSIETSGVIN